MTYRYEKNSLVVYRITTHGMVRQLGVPDECDIRVGVIVRAKTCRFWVRIRVNVRSCAGIE